MLYLLDLIFQSGMKNEAIDLSELLLAVKEGVECGFPGKIWVRAEIASIQAKGGGSHAGHCYMELCQSNSRGICAKVKAIIWQYNYLLLSRFFRQATGSDMASGMKVLVLAQVNFSELYGLSLIIDDIDPSYTLGDAEAKKRETVERLRKEGVMDAQKELPLSPLPYRLAVISSPDAAGYGDFCRHLTDNEYGFVYEITLIQALMQGDAAPFSISSALPDSPDTFDAVLIIRGGGSALDLSCFDDYNLCAAIAGCPVPVFTAVGHDRDVHVVDMVSYQSVKTPTALADLFISAYAREDERIGGYGRRLGMAFMRKLSDRQMILDSVVSELKGAFAERLNVSGNILDRIADRIRTTNPLNVLSRGFSLVADEKGVVVKSAGALKEREIINIYFADGIVSARVTEK